MVIKSIAMQSTSQLVNNDVILRNASEPYLLLFEEGQYKLSLEALEAHADDKDLKHKRFHWPSIKFVSLKDGMLELVVVSVAKSYILLFRLKKTCFR